MNYVGMITEPDSDRGTKKIRDFDDCRTETDSSKGQNLAVTVSRLPCSLDSGLVSPGAWRAAISVSRVEGTREVIESLPTLNC